MEQVKDSSASGEDRFNGIPRAPFIEDVDAIMKQEKFGKNAEEALRSLDRMYTNYKMIEATLEAQRQKFVLCIFVSLHLFCFRAC